MKKDSYTPGEVCWIDCGTDLTKAPAFYAQLFGWTIDSLGEEAGGYSMASKGGDQVAGLAPQQSPGMPYWTVYFRVDDAVKTAELVTANGGSTLVGPMEVMEAGHMGVFTDPVGAVFAVWQPKQHAGFGAVGEPGTFCWAELVTTDVDRSRTFYGEVFGHTTRDSTEMAYTELRIGDQSVAGMMPKPAEMPAEIPPMWGVYFAVSDTDAAIAKVGELGGMTVFGPTDVDQAGRFANCVDPAGAMFGVITPAQA